MTNYGPSRLFNNLGNGRFEDVATNAGLPHSDTSPRSTGCAWGDYDRDGLLDLVVTRYVYDLGIASDMFEGDPTYELIEEGEVTVMGH